ncbi:MAG TPA: glycogen/starch synthase [Bacteroidaceae bacterium]|nr:glycogen/starch synthase [Bacteroidaceae bacterium]
MSKEGGNPNYIFIVSWEVCNMVGGIYTVLSTQAKMLAEKSGATLVYIGPDFQKDQYNPLFEEDRALYSTWLNSVWKSQGLAVRVGRWRIPGKPIVFLIDFQPYYAMKNIIYKKAWELFKIDSLHGYGDYDEASMFSYAAAKTVSSFYKYYLGEKDRVIYHAHEWMAGMGMLFLKSEIPAISTVFTTHATTVGRSIASNNKLLYQYFDGYNGDQMSSELNVESKHSVEKQSALRADCFTTVSELTARECAQFFGRVPDVITVNGFENDFVPSDTIFAEKRAAARKTILMVASRLFGYNLDNNTVIIGTGGRYEFRNKGLDLFIDSLNLLREEECVMPTNILTLINVPVWISEARTDLQHRVNKVGRYRTALKFPFTTHSIYNMEQDKVLNALGAHGFGNTRKESVKIIFVPCYLDGNDGIFNMSYYDLLIGHDLALFPSYYEPWGYTPLESSAFRVPTVTTDLAGFGLWANSLKNRYSELKEGVKVIHRTDNNYDQAALAIKNTIMQWLFMSQSEKNQTREAAAKVADKALWKKFIDNYIKAYQIAALNSTTKNKCQKR